MKVLIKYEVNGNSIVKEHRYFLNFEDFKQKFILKKMEEGFENVSFTRSYCLLQKENNYIRCFW